MTRSEKIDYMNAICREECEKYQKKILAAIKRRVKREMTADVNVSSFRGNQPYATTSGPKMIGPGKADARFSNFHMVMPLCVFEWSNE